MSDLTPEQEEQLRDAATALGTSLSETARAFFAACGPMSSIMQQAATTLSVIVEDATRDNAYRPTGIVLDSTAQIIDEETKALPVPREEA